MCHAARAAHHTFTQPIASTDCTHRLELMEEVASPQPLGDSFSCGWFKCGTAEPAPSFDADLGSGLCHSFGSSRSFIDMDPAVLFSMRWTAALPATDFDFGLPDAGDSPSSPMLVSAGQIIVDGRLLLLPCELTRRSGVQEHEDRVTPRLAASSPPYYHSAQSTAVPCMSSCSSTWMSIAGGNKNSKPSPLLLAGRRSSGRASSSWKIPLRYLRFLMPLYRKVRALRQLSAAQRPRVAPARASTSSSLEWCHGNADTAVRDAILYCKKSSANVH